MRIFISFFSSCAVAAAHVFSIAEIVVARWFCEEHRNKNKKEFFIIISGILLLLLQFLLFISLRK
jgi:uncharacterized integral membrane protein